MTQQGHNAIGGINAPQLESFLDRVEKLNAEKHSIGLDISEVFKEAKSAGFDTKIMRKVVALRMLDKTKRDEQDELLRLYRAAAGIDPFS